MPYADYQRGEVAALGREIYLKQIKHLMKPEDIGQFVAIDVESGDYEMDIRVAEALHRLRQRRPDAVTTAERVGYRAPFSIGFPQRPEVD